MIRYGGNKDTEKERFTKMKHPSLATFTSWSSLKLIGYYQLGSGSLSFPMACRRDWYAFVLKKPLNLPFQEPLVLRDIEEWGSALYGIIRNSGSLQSEIRML